MWVLQGFAKIRIAPGGFSAPIIVEIVRSRSRAESSLRSLGVRSLLALCLELGELLSGKNSFRVSQECLTAFLCAACLHAFGLPGFDFGFLIQREIQRG